MGEGDDDEVSGGLTGLTKESLQQLFEMINGQPVQPSRASLLDRTPPGPQPVRVSLTKRKVTASPHCWRRTGSKDSVGIIDWECAKCRGLAASGAKIRPDPHLTPSCDDILVDEVHGL